MGSLRGLAVACHAAPTVAVTAITAAFGAAAGLGGWRLGLLVAAVLAGQLSIGWSNDLLDRERDAAAGRSGKPLATGRLRAGQVRVATGAAVLACVPLSLALGLVPGTIHLLAVGSGWAYNRWLKFTVASPLPYLVSFALLPAIVATALPGTPAPQPVLPAAGALLGLAAHFANTVADTEADRRSGVRGLPQRLGPAGSVLVAAGLTALVAALLIGLLPAARRPGPLALLGAGVALAAGCIAAASGPRAARSNLVFRCFLGAAGLIVAGFVASGSGLVGG